MEPELNIAIPDDIKCPITLSLMWSPVTTPCMHNFGRAAMERWINDNGGAANCPMCNTRVRADQLIDNPGLAQQVRLFHTEHPELNPWADINPIQNVAQPQVRPLPQGRQQQPTLNWQGRLATSILERARNGANSFVNNLVDGLAQRIPSNFNPLGVIARLFNKVPVFLTVISTVIKSIFGGIISFFSRSPAANLRPVTPNTANQPVAIPTTQQTPPQPQITSSSNQPLLWAAHTAVATERSRRHRNADIQLQAIARRGARPS